MNGAWRVNINFLAVPIELIRQFKGKISESEWVVWADWYNKSPSIWNMAYTEGSEVKMFIYGMWEPLERELRVTRITASKDLQGVKGTIIWEAIDHLRLLARDMHAKKVYCETTSWRVFMRKLKGDIKINEAKILEVL